MRVIVESVDYSGGTLARGIGQRVDEPERIIFAGDCRPMRDIAQALEQGEEVEVEVEGWAILGREAL